MRIVPKIIREHVSLTAFLWSQRASLLSDDPPDMEAVKAVSLRLEANIDALRIAGAAGWEIALALFEEYPEAGEMFVLGLLAIWDGQEEKTDQIVELAHKYPEAGAGLAGALTWLQPAETAPVVRTWLGAGDSLKRFFAVSALVEHKADVGPRLTELLSDEDVGTAAVACKLAAATKRGDCLPILRDLCRHKDGPLAFEASRACCELGDDAGTSALQQAAIAEGPYALTALRALVEYQPKDKTRLWLGTLNQSDETRHIAVRGAGMMGDASVLPWLVGCMSNPALAVAAAAAFLELHGPLDEIDDHFYPDAATAGADLGPEYAELEGRIPRAETFAALLNDMDAQKVG